MELMIMTPIGSSIATRRRARWRTVFPLLYLFPFFASISERDGSETWVDVETCACVARGMVVNRLLSFSVPVTENAVLQVALDTPKPNVTWDV
jgi:hypothetical protein